MLSPGKIFPTPASTVRQPTLQLAKAQVGDLARMVLKVGVGRDEGMGVSNASASNLQRDPICGRRLEHQADNLSAEYKKRRYYFCSEKCKSAFHQQTERFRLNELARAGALFTPGKVRWGLG